MSETKKQKPIDKTKQIRINFNDSDFVLTNPEQNTVADPPSLPWKHSIRQVVTLLINK